MIYVLKFKTFFYSFDDSVSSMFSPGFAVGPDYYLKSRVSQHRNKRARPKNGISIIIITETASNPFKALVNIQERVKKRTEEIRVQYFLFAFTIILPRLRWYKDGGGEVKMFSKIHGKDKPNSDIELWRRNFYFYGTHCDKSLFFVQKCIFFS